MSKDRSKENAPLLEAIRLRDDKVIKQIYLENKKKFVPAACKIFMQKEAEVNEYYHECFLVFVDNVQKGKLTKLTCQLHTYLLAISKRLRKESFRNQQRDKLSTQDTEFWLNVDGESSSVDTSILEHYEDEHRKKIVRSLLSRISPSCQKLLNLIFYKNHSLAEIVELMEYSDERVVRKRKSICMKKLREIAQSFKDKLH